MRQRLPRPLLVLPVLVLLTGGALSWIRLGPHAADAAVVHHAGWHARVDGVQNWYGSYQLAELGLGWCIDPDVAHPPDAALAYVPDAVAEAGDATRAAMAWAAGRNADADAVSAAATTLVLHDLLGRAYGSGALRVDTLPPGALQGFAGHEQAVVDRARAIRADAVAHAHLRGPLRLELTAAPVAPGAPGELVARLLDAGAQPVAGVAVLAAAWGPALDADPLGTTATDGTVRWPYRAVAGLNAFSALALPPDPTLAAFAPTLGPGQRVVVPRTTRLDATTSYTTERPTGRVRVDKRGDVAHLPVTGARFELQPVDGSAAVRPVELTVGPDGSTPVAEVEPGRWRVVEVEPPPGYTVAPPVDVHVPAGELVEVVVLDTARRGELRVAKVDGVSHTLLAGARFELRHDRDRDGDPETLLRELRTAEVATVVRDLVPGDYALVEVEAPPGYQRLRDPVRFTIDPGEVERLTVENRRRPAPTTTTSTTTPPTTTPPTTTPPTTTPPTVPPETSPPTAPPPPRTAPPVPPVPRRPPAVPSGPLGPPTLPATGPQHVVLAGFGAISVAAGLVLVVAGRRRR